MTKRFFLQGVICMLLILNIFVIFKIKKSNSVVKELGYLTQRLQNNISEKQQIIDESDEVEAHELINLDIDIPIDSILKVRKKFDLPLLVYRFSSMGCQSCVDSMLALIKNAPDMLKRNILIISDNKTTHELYVRLHYAGLDQIKYAVSQKLSFPFDSAKIPYLFIIDSNMVIRMFFIPNSRNKKRTIGYLNYIIKKY